MLHRLTLQQTRWLILGLLIAAIVITAGAFLVKRQYRRSHATELPPLISGNMRESQGFSLSQTEQGRTVFKLKAQRVRQQETNGKSLLEEVEIITFGAQGNRQDRIYTHLCEYDPGTGTVTSRGETQMELGPPGDTARKPADPAANADAPRVTPVPQAPVPAEPGAVKPSIFVKTSGVTFEQKTGIVRTAQPLEFTFSRGKGKAVGAVYNSNLRQLHLNSAVEIETQAHNVSDIANAANPREPAPAPGIPVFIKASALDYEQKNGQVRAEHVEMRRPVEMGGTRELSGDHGEVKLDNENRATAADITGNARVNELLPAAKDRPARETHLASNQLQMWFTPAQSLQTVVATGSVVFNAVTAREHSETTAARMAMAFREENELSSVTWNGGTHMRIVPVDASADTRLISSNAIIMFMKPDGREPETARTLAPGRLELVPGVQTAAAGARRSVTRRILNGDMIWMKFGENSEVDQLTANGNVRLESHRLAVQASGTTPPPQPIITTSDSFGASFRDGRIVTSTQTGHFHYVEGERQANAEAASFTGAEEHIELGGRPGRNPEVWDATTRTSAVRIVLDQKNNVGIAERDVRTVYQPADDGKKQAPKNAAGKTPAKTAGSSMQQVPGPLASDRPVYVIADRMVTSSKTGVTRYEASGATGRVRLWQDQDVIEAHTIVLERNERRMKGEGQVTTVLVENTTDKPSGSALLAQNQPAGRGVTAGTHAAGGATPPGTPRVTGQPAVQAVVVKADTLVYTESDRRAHYERRVVFRRGATLMDSDVLDAFLLPAEEVQPGESRLQRAIGRGNVRINESAPAGNRRAESEVAEYSTAEDKMTLSGGNPYVFDENRGYTRGRQLTYYLRDDSIFVHGDGASRTVTEQRVTKRR